MRTFLCRVCTFTYIRLIHFPLYLVKQLADISDLVCNVINALSQILLMGKPYYWGLRYRKIVSPDRRLVILANGPSLNEDIELLKKEDLSKTDFVMMNYSANSDLFEKLRPKFYCLADHAFFRPLKELDKISRLYFDIEKKLNWDMTMVLSYNVKVVKGFSKLTNPLIKFQRVFALDSVGPKKFQWWMCKHGFAIPGLGTVTNLAAFTGIQYGYKQIEFCGNDMSFFDGICVDDDNHPCTYTRHFYDKEPEKRPVMINDTTYQTLETYVDMVHKMIISHNKISEYGKHMGVKFINRTRNSMLDCYPRLIKLYPELISKNSV